MYRESVKCKIFLRFTSNLISSGVRDIIRYLVQHHMVEVIVTTAGGVEEDLIKCLADTYRGEFSLPGAALRSEGLNRTDAERTKNKERIMDYWTPSKVIARLGKEINDESSYLNWAYKLDWRLSHEQIRQDCSEEEKNPMYRESVKCKIFLGFTSNLISFGVRDIIRYLVQHHMVEVIVTTAGGIEEDLIICLADTYEVNFLYRCCLALRSEGQTALTMASVQISSYPAPECQTMALEHDSLSPGRNCQENVSHGNKTGTTSNELDLLFSPMFDELLNRSSKVVSKSSAVSVA
nr:hypothetical protein [Tanacetum cinerariifolium]